MWLRITRGMQYERVAEKILVNRWVEIDWLTPIVYCSTIRVEKLRKATRLPKGSNQCHSHIINESHCCCCIVLQETRILQDTFYCEGVSNF